MSNYGIDFQFAQVYKNFVRDFINNGHQRYSLYGGRDSAKSTTLYMLEILELLNKGSVLVVRRYKTNLASSSYNGVSKVIRKYNLGSYFKIKKSPLQIVCKLNGNVIDFAGLDSPDKLRSMEAPNENYTLLVFEESQEIKLREQCDDVISSLERGGGSEQFKCIWIFNPPANKMAWQNLELRQSIDDYLYALNVNYCDIPKKWVGRGQLKEIERIKANNPKLYRYRYLGEPIAAEDAVFENIVEARITDEQIETWEQSASNIYTGLDFGYKPDKNAATESFYDFETRTLYIFREFYRGKLNNMQICEGLEQAGFDRGFKMICDSADPKSIDDLKADGWFTGKSIKGKWSVEAGFYWLMGLTAIKIDEQRCPNTYREFSEYHYELDRDGGLNNTFKWKQDDHAIASVRYALEPVWRKAGM